jgi:hypothetical protein
MWEFSKPLHSNRKIVAHGPENLVIDDKNGMENISRIALLNAAFHDLNQAIFETLSYLEISKEFSDAFALEHDSFLRDLHSQFVNAVSCAIQVWFFCNAFPSFCSFSKLKARLEGISSDPVRASNNQEVSKATVNHLSSASRRRKWQVHEESNVGNASRTA